MGNSAAIRKLMVTDVMSDSVIFVQETDSIPKTLQTFETKRISAAPVKNSNGDYVGIVTKSDLSKLDVLIKLIKLEASLSERSLLIKNVMNPIDPMTLPKNTTLKEASQFMVEKRIHHVFIHNEEQNITGVISTFDIAKVYASVTD